MQRALVFVRIGMLCLMVASLGSGCRSMRLGRRGQTGRRGAADEVFTPMVLDGDFVLGERFEEGERVTDVQFEPVYFAYDSFALNPTETAKIQRVADYMRRNQRTRLVVEGHTDERGSREYNLSLGERRALSIRSALISSGIDPSRIQTRSFGKEQPVAFGSNEEAWRRNRRGEFVLYR